MKWLLSLILLTGPVYALEIELEEFDQLKLAEFLASLPQEIKHTKTQEITFPKEGKLIQTHFPLNRGAPYAFSCEASYFNGARFASSAVCKITIDEKHSEIRRAHDEVLISIQDTQLASALHRSIPMGRPLKNFRSFGKENGSNFDGLWGWVFHYQITCGPESCEMKFSTLASR